MGDEQATDFRSDRMPSPEGKGIARRAWDAYAAQVNRVAGPAIEPIAKKAAVPLWLDMLGFWMAWHLEGGFEGLQQLGMSRASIYRRIKLFRKTLGMHPDEFTFAGVKLDVKAYQAGKPKPDL